ncbi:hypothetical protein Y047_6060 [Burkholderia pseudomallei MSHR3016]|nr:hypothetical protein DP56_6153 [Burkholderia pseudomallei]KGW38019.1 hypothetical protein Y047_6060 [Burkholderia pseudomallei MSHR3016]
MLKSTGASQTSCQPAVFAHRDNTPRIVPSETRTSHAGRVRRGTSVTGMSAAGRSAAGGCPAVAAAPAGGCAAGTVSAARLAPAGAAVCGARTTSTRGAVSGA